MVAYVGSKRLIAKRILPILMEGHNSGAAYIEPFVGGCNMMEHIRSDIPRVGSDNNPWVIALYKGLLAGEAMPDRVSEYEYSVANDCRFVDFRTAFIGFGCSYGGKFFGGYARNSMDTNYAIQFKRGLFIQRSKLRGVSFIHSDYEGLSIPDGSTVYCDPPYEGTLGYGAAFNHSRFWSWAEELSGRCRVFVSEYSAPPGWSCVWSGTVRSGMDDAVKTEKLWRCY